MSRTDGDQTETIERQRAEIERQQAEIERLTQHGPQWIHHALRRLHEQVDLTDPDDPVGKALTIAGLERAGADYGPDDTEANNARRAELTGVVMTFSPTKSAQLIAKCREDDERMTKGPWESQEFWRDKPENGYFPSRWRIFLRGHSNPATNSRDCDWTQSDAEGIARTRNSLPEIAEQLEAGMREVERLQALLPRCLGAWLSGSGGHRRYANDCGKPAQWDVGMGFVCNEHKTTGDDDAWEWWKERALYAEALGDKGESLVERLLMSVAQRSSLQLRITELERECERMSKVYEAALAWYRAPHVNNANHAAGDCDECPARVAEAVLRITLAAACGVEPDRFDVRVAASIDRLLGKGNP